MIKPRPPHQAADKFLRLAKLAVTLGMEFEDAAIGVEHELIASIGPALPRLSSALQTLSQDMRRQAMTPPPAPEPVPKPTPILDLCGVLETAEAPPPPAEVVPEVPKLRPFVVSIPDPLTGKQTPIYWVEFDTLAQAMKNARWYLEREDFAVLSLRGSLELADYRGLPCLAEYDRARLDAALAIRLQANAEKTRTFAAYIGRNPVFYVLAASVEAAGDAINQAMPEHSLTRVAAVEPEWATARKLPSLDEWAAQVATETPKPAEAIRAQEAHPKVPAPKPSRRKAWLVLVAGKPAFNVLAHLHGDVQSQLASAGIPTTSYREAQLTIEEVKRGKGAVIGVYYLDAITPEKAREVVRAKLAEAEHESGSGFVAPMPEDDDGQVEGDDQPPVRPFLATHKPTGRELFTILAGDEAEARDRIGMMLTFEQDGLIALEAVADTFRELPDWEDFKLDSLELPPDAPADDTPPTRPAYPTEAPRDPLATLPVGELKVRKDLLEVLVELGMRTAAQLEEELGTDSVDGAVSDADQEYIRNKIREWELARVKRIIKDGSWLDEELTYAAFRDPDAEHQWAICRERGLTDDELRNAINKLFPPRICGGWGQHFRAGHYFEPGNAPAFHLGGAKPKRGQEPALEGNPLLDAVRRLLAIPTREGPAKGEGKGDKRRKAVKA